MLLDSLLSLLDSRVHIVTCDVLAGISNRVIVVSCSQSCVQCTVGRGIIKGYQETRYRHARSGDKYTTMPINIITMRKNFHRNWT